MNLQFSKNLKYLRNQKNLTQAEFANLICTTQRRISYFESGKIEPDLSTLWQIADFFDVSVDYLIGRKEY